jgi:putative transcriptional regulator
MMHAREQLHEGMNDELRELASLYALGAMTQEESAAYEAHLSAGCPVCQAEVGAFREVTGGIALSVEPVTPPAELRERLMNTAPKGLQVDAGSAPGTMYEKNGVFISRPQEMDWTSGQLPGLFSKVLFNDSQRGYSTALVRMLAGAHYPTHKHAGVEELYLLEGELNVDELSMRPGDYCRGEVGSIHGEIFTNTGCLFLVSSSHHDEILA